MKTTLFILSGESFSGKSVLSKEIVKHYHAEIIGRDVVYRAIKDKLALEKTPEEDDRALWNNMWPIVVQGAKNLLLSGKSVVIDDTCLQLQKRNDLRSVTNITGAQVVLIYLDIPATILKDRKQKNKINKERHDVPSVWIEDGAKYFDRPTELENPIIYTFGQELKELFTQID